MTTSEAATLHVKAVAVAAVLALVLLVLRYVLKIDVWYVISGGVPWVFSVETALAGFLLGWFLASRRR